MTGSASSAPEWSGRASSASSTSRRSGCSASTWSGVVGSARRAPPPRRLAPVYDSLEALLADDTVDVVHLTTPNHLHHPQVKQALAAGKHVVCEKPLAMTSEESAELLALARRAGSSTARTSISASSRSSTRRAGAWRTASSARSGTSTAATSRTGSSTRPTGTGGSRPTRAARCARSATSARTGWTWRSSSAASGSSSCAPTSPRRSRCGAGRSGRSRRSRTPPTSSASDAPMTTEDLGHVLVRFDGGARGAFKVSQGSAGPEELPPLRGRRLRGAVAWNAERHEELWLGRRDGPNGILQRNAALMRPDAAARTSLPAGTPRGGSTRSASSTARCTRQSRRARPRSRTTRRSPTDTARTCSVTRSPSRTGATLGGRGGGL